MRGVCVCVCVCMCVCTCVDDITAYVCGNIHVRAHIPLPHHPSFLLPPRILTLSPLFSVQCLPICLSVCVYTCMTACLYVCLNECMCMCMCAYVCFAVYMYVCVYVCFVCAHMYCVCIVYVHICACIDHHMCMRVCMVWYVWRGFSLSLLWEKPSRRPELALFTLPRALDSLWKTLIKLRYVRSVPHAHTGIFAVAMGCIMMFYQHESGTIKPGYLSLLRRLFGHN